MRSPAFLSKSSSASPGNLYYFLWGVPGLISHLIIVFYFEHGVVLFDREHYWKCGGANEAFKSVGYEDNEINIIQANLHSIEYGVLPNFFDEISKICFLSKFVC